MTKILNKTELVDIRKKIFDFINASITRRNNLVSMNKMTPNDSDKIAIEQEEPCQEIADQLTELVLKSVTADLDANEIIIATRNLEDAVAKLEQLNQFIGIFAVVINIAEKIVTAFTTGNPLVIAGILEDAESFL